MWSTLSFLALRRFFRVLRLGPKPADKDVEIAVLRHQLAVVRRIIVPLTMPGILAGSVIVFALAASAFATPAIIGGRRLKVIATAAYDEFLNTLNWPLGASLAVLLLLTNVALLYLSNRLIERHFKAVFAETAT